MYILGYKIFIHIIYVFYDFLSYLTPFLCLNYNQIIVFAIFKCNQKRLFRFFTTFLRWYPVAIPTLVYQMRTYVHGCFNVNCDSDDFSENVDVLL